MIMNTKLNTVTIFTAILMALTLAACGDDGKRGIQGEQGPQGPGCSGVELKGGEWIWTCCDPAEDKCWEEPAPTGPPGEDGKDGTNGTDGKDGEDGSNGTNGTDGKDGKDGTDGQDGSNGNSSGGTIGGTTTNGWNLCAYTEQFQVSAETAGSMASSIRSGDSQVVSCGSTNPSSGNGIYVAVNNDSSCGSDPLVMWPKGSSWTGVFGYASGNANDNGSYSSANGNHYGVQILNDQGPCVVVFQASNGFNDVTVGF